jgi:hypothetical protein
MRAAKYFCIGIMVSALVGCSPLFAIHLLHLSFHQGCISELNMIAEKVGFQISSLFVPGMNEQEFDGHSSGNALYNISHERAEHVWNRHQDFFNQFDAIITSDTASLARIFLQNNYEKPLIIWVCNRFDYYDAPTLDSDFPDEEYYELLRTARNQNNVYSAPYTPFESVYAAHKNVTFNYPVIRPTGMYHPVAFSSAIPIFIIKSETFFIPSYLNDVFIPREQLAAATYKGRYKGPDDIKDFKGIIHIPYAWSTLAFFENMHNGIPYLVPSYAFMKTLMAQEDIWWQNNDFFDEHYQCAEWYDPRYSTIITYFDSWQDLNDKLLSTDFEVLKQRIQSFAQKQKENTIEQWKKIIDEIKENN